MSNWKPWKYQEDAIAFALQRDGAGLMLDPGLGKTSITLAVVDVCKDAGDIRKTLVIAPLRVCQLVWPAEARKWDDFHHLKVVDLSSIPTKQREAAMAGPGDIFVINPEACVGKKIKDTQNTTPAVFDWLTPEFDMLVIDESTKFKDTQTSRFKGLRKVLHNFKRRVILTGTPIPNGVQDLFGQMMIVDLGESLGKYVSHFRMEFCHQHPSGFGWELNRGADDMIYKRVKNRLMRLDAVDHLKMPELVNNFIEVKLPAALVPQYKALEKDFVAQIGSEKLAVLHIGTIGNKLRQIANGFVYDDKGGTIEREARRLHTEKLDALEALLDEMQGRPLFVAYEFDEDSKMLQERFDGADGRPLAINLGKVKNVKQITEMFNRGEIPLLIAQPGSVSHGLNLQEFGNTVCWYGITWNLELYQQFIARVWRQGQPSPVVVVHHIVCKGTKDENVMGALKGKDRTQKSFNNAIKK